MDVETRPILDPARIRGRFPGLSREQDGRPCVLADAPGGTQVPDSVIEAMGAYLARSNANTFGAFATSAETDRLIADARQAVADLLGADPGEIAFGQNMTTLSFAFARAVGRTLSSGDEVVVTALDHDANITPWLVAARDAGATIRWAGIDPGDGTLDLESLERAIGPRTRVVAFTLASNALGTVTPADRIVGLAHRAGALAVGDAVHVAPHRALDVRRLGLDVLFCSAYKFFGPHLGLMYGRPEVLSDLRPDKVRPADDAPPWRWETGTLNHEGLAGLVAAVDYLASLAGGVGNRRAAIVEAMEAVQAHERGLSERFLAGAGEIAGFRVYGLADPGRAGERTPTFALRVGTQHPRVTAEALASRGVYVWDGNYYALAVMEALGLEESGGAARVGFCHYHTLDEVDRVLGDLRHLAASAT